MSKNTPANLVRAGVVGAAIMLSTAAFASDYEVRITPDRLQTLAGAESVHAMIKDTARKVCPQLVGAARHGGPYAPVEPMWWPILSGRSTTRC